MACSRARAARKHFPPVGLKPGEEGLIAKEPVFGDFRVAGAKFARRQRIQQRRIGHHQNRLVECADQVLAVAGIDRGLAADGGIDLRQQRGRHLHVIEAAARDGGRKAGQIADHATAERHHQVATLDPRGD